MLNTARGYVFFLSIEEHELQSELAHLRNFVSQGCTSSRFQLDCKRFQAKNKARERLRELQDFCAKLITLRCKAGKVGCRLETFLSSQVDFVVGPPARILPGKVRSRDSRVFTTTTRRSKQLVQIAKNSKIPAIQKSGGMITGTFRERTVSIDKVLYYIRRREAVLASAGARAGHDGNFTAKNTVQCGSARVSPRLVIHEARSGRRVPELFCEFADEGVVKGDTDKPGAGKGIQLQTMSAETLLSSRLRVPYLGSGFTQSEERTKGSLDNRIIPLFDSKIAYLVSSRRKTRSPRGPAFGRSGWCFCCKQHFSSLGKHLESRDHKSFMARKENFAEIDAFLDKFAQGKRKGVRHDNPWEDPSLCMKTVTLPGGDLDYVSSPSNTAAASYSQIEDSSCGECECTTPQTQPPPLMKLATRSHVDRKIGVVSKKRSWETFATSPHSNVAQSATSSKLTPTSKRLKRCTPTSRRKSSRRKCERQFFIPNLPNSTSFMSCNGCERI